MKLIRSLGVALWAVCASALVHAQAYPDKSRPIRIIVPFGAGSATDLMGRAIARAMKERAGVDAIVENKPGAEGVIGMQAAKTAPADGYTMVLANISTQVLNPHMLPKLPYDPVTDFVPIAGVAKFSNVLNATSGLPFKHLGELIDAAKKNPEKYRFGSATTMTRLEMTMFEHFAKVKVLQVPYKAMAEATTALVSGEIDLLMNDETPPAWQLPIGVNASLWRYAHSYRLAAAAFYPSGKIRPLAVTGAARMPGLPNVPTFRELGLQDYELTGWIAMYFPAKTPPATVSKMRDILQDAAKSPAIAEVMSRASFEPLDLNGAQVTALQKADSERLGKLVRTTGLHPQ